MNMHRWHESLQGWNETKQLQQEIPRSRYVRLQIPHVIPVIPHAIYNSSNALFHR